jgi:hypothetical protein
VSPDRTGPGHAAAERDQHRGFRFIDATRLSHLIETQADGTGGTVPELVDVHEHLLAGKSEFFDGALNNAGVRLVADVGADFIGSEAGLLERVLDRPLEAGDRELVDLAAVHSQAAEFDGVFFITGCDIDLASRDVERLPAATVSFHGLVDRALGGVVIRLENRGSRSIAEEDRDRAIVVVDDRAHAVAAHDRDSVGTSDSDQAVCEIHGVDEAAASGHDVEGARGRRANLAGDPACERRA